jgi:hypothetical protein
MVVGELAQNGRLGTKHTELASAEVLVLEQVLCVRQPNHGAHAHHNTPATDK